ncbi:MAG: hypothetical protein AB7O56_13280 [Bauldia sp.]
MPTRAMIALAFATVLFALAAATSARPQTAAFAEGQMWSIRPPAAESVRVVIGRLEPWSEGTIVHVSILGVPVPDGPVGAPATRRTIVGHLPIEERALVASVDRLLATDAAPAPTFAAGYQQWEDAKGGIFTVTVAEAIDVVLAALVRR